MTPPLFARWLVRLSTSAEDRRSILAELDEEFDRVAAESPPRARRWYRAQARRSAGPMLVQRLQSAWRGWTADARQALRGLRRKPRVPAALGATLGLALAAALATFAAVDAVLLRPLPFVDPDRIVALWSTGPSLPATVRAVSFQDLEDWRRESSGLSAVSAFTPVSHTLTGRGDARRIEGVRVGLDFDRVLGIRAVAGQLFTADDFHPGATDVIVLTDAFWRREFGASPSAIGQTLMLDDRPRRIVGVLPPMPMPFPAVAHDFWSPLMPRQGAPWESSRATGWIDGVGRVRAGVSLSEAKNELDGIVRALAAQYPDSNRDRVAAGVQPLQDQLVATARPALLLVAAAVVALLLVAFGSGVHLLVAQNSVRRREFAMRHALGAGPARLRRQALAEAAMLTLGAVSIAMALAPALLSAFAALPDSALPRREEMAISSAAPRWLPVALAVTFIVIAWPLTRLAVRAPSADVGSTRVAGRRGDRRVRHVLVAAQAAMAVVLLAGSVLFVRTLKALESVDLGFSASGVLTLQPTPSRTFAPSARQTMEFYRELLDSVRSMPGVQAVSASTSVPFVISGWSYGVTSKDDPQQRRQLVRVTVASPDHFQALRVPILAGRAMSEDEHRGSAGDAAVISRTLARLLFGDTDAVGQLVDYSNRQWRVAGIVPDLRQGRVTTADVAELYMPWHNAGQRPQALVVRATGETAPLAAAIAARARAIDPAATIAGISTLGERVRSVLAPQRFRAGLVTTLAAMAVLLSVFGVYSVTAFGVATQAREQAIRIALGESRPQARRRVIVAAVRPAAIGAAAGVAAAWAGGRFVEAMLFEVQAHDPVVLTAVPLAIVLLTVIAAWAPASRAAREDPTRVLTTT
jgi:predicted permease